MEENTFGSVYNNESNQKAYNQNNFFRALGILFLLFLTMPILASNGHGMLDHAPFVKEVEDRLPFMGSINFKSTVKLLAPLKDKFEIKPLITHARFNIDKAFFPFKAKTETTFEFNEMSNIQFSELIRKYDFKGLATDKAIDKEIKEKTTSPLPDLNLKTIAERRTWIEDNELITPDLKEVKSAAAVEGKMYMISFKASWCVPCRVMEKNVFGDETVSGYMEENYKHHTVDIDDFDGITLKQIYEIKVLPSILIFNSEGELVAKYEKAVSANKMLDILKQHNNQQENTIQDNQNIVFANTTDTGKLNYYWQEIVYPGHCRK